MIYRFCRRIRTALYNVFVQPAIRRSFAACGRGTRIGRGGDFYPFSHIRIGDRVVDSSIKTRLYERKKELSALQLA